MPKQISVVVLLLVALSTSSAHAVTVERKRLVFEQIPIDKLLGSFVRGLGYKLADLSEGGDLSGMEQAAERLRIEPKSMTVTLRDGAGREQTFEVEKAADKYRIEVTASADGFDLKTVHHISQSLDLWATVRGHRVHLVQELEYNRPGRFVRVDLRLLNSVGRVTGAKFYFELYEKDLEKRTRVETSLAISARVPGRPCGIIHRIARRQIAAKSDQALCTLDQKVREIVIRGQGNWLELVPILASRALAGLR